MQSQFQLEIQGQDLDFILSHFQEPLWPRTIATKTTDKRQVLIFNKREAFARFAQANWLDCRISAYPSFTEYKGINRQAPNFIFIDLDRSSFKTERSHKIALNTTLKNIREKLGGNPTVLWSGNGYHVYQPIEAFILEQEKIFANLSELASRKFMQFAEYYLSNGKCDYAHNITVSFKNCMVRIPGSVNSKNGQVVRVIQEWNGYRPAINYLLREFRRYLIDQIIKKQLQPQKHNTSYHQSIRKYFELNALKGRGWGKDQSEV